MSPTVIRKNGYRLFFFSREESRIHVHVSHANGEAKFWLTPTVHLATSTGLSAKQVRDAQQIVETHLHEVIHAWNRHFS
jgi:Domain of unknown function (DUF4160)